MDDFIPVEVVGVYLTGTPQGPASLVIISNDEGRIMPIYIGMSEGISINSALNNEITRRPMTHDLTTNIIVCLDARIKEVLIDEINDDVSHDFINNAIERIGAKINEVLIDEIKDGMTHDLMTTLIGRLGARINEVIIDEIKNNIYYARLNLMYNGSNIEIDARPSDCISLAVRTNSPIKVRRSVFESSVIHEDELQGMMTMDSLL